MDFFNGLCIGILIGFFPIGALIFKLFGEYMRTRRNVDIRKL